MEADVSDGDKSKQMQGLGRGDKSSSDDSTPEQCLAWKSKYLSRYIFLISIFRFLPLQSCHVHFFHGFHITPPFCSLSFRLFRRAGSSSSSASRARFSDYLYSYVPISSDFPRLLFSSCRRAEYFFRSRNLDCVPPRSVSNSSGYLYGPVSQCG